MAQGLGSYTKQAALPATTANSSSHPSQSRFKYKAQVAELRFAQTNRPLLQPPLRNTGLMRSTFFLSFLRFSMRWWSKGKIRPRKRRTHGSSLVWEVLKAQVCLGMGCSNMGICGSVVADAR